jgi:pimeloyl-ACP methyl ester carboxylesterase
MRNFFLMIFNFFMKKKPTTTQKKKKKPSPSTKKTTMNQNLYALMVAIDQYQAPIPPLKGCENDRNALKVYLERQFAGQDKVQAHIKTLTNAEATKQRIIDEFQQHFKNAQQGDICLFYYSGHGAPSPAPPEFWHLDPDGMTEGLVCYDSRRTTKDLMDKELSYLIAKATQGKDLHFVAVFDCCHSGTITRDATFTPRTTAAPPIPAMLQDYFGHQEYQRVPGSNGQLLISPPAGTYIQLAACRDQETAKETLIDNKTRGVFTYSLIEALEQNGGALSYADLIHILQVRLANKVRDQLPQLISKGIDKNQNFLGGVIEGKNGYLVQFQQGRWLMNAGAVQGIPVEGGEITLEDDRTLRLSVVEPNVSVVQGLESEDVNKVFRVVATNLNTKKIPVAFDPQINNDGKRLIDTAWKDVLPPSMKLVEQPTDAYYWIRFVENSFQLTLPADARPLFKRVENPSHANAVAFLNAAERVAKWRSLLDLSKVDSKVIQNNEFAIELYQVTDPGNYEDNAPVAVPITGFDEPVVFRYEKTTNGEWAAPAFRMKVRNTGNRVLYFSAVNLMDNFGMTNRFMDKQELAPGKEAWLMERDKETQVQYLTIPLTVNDEAYGSYNITEVKEYFKIFISNDPKLDTSRYEQEGLELDVKKAGSTTRAGGVQRKPQAMDWITRDIEMIVVRPMEPKQLAEGKTVALDETMKVTAPRGMSAQFALTTADEATRGTAPAAGTRSLDAGSESRGQAMAFTPPMNRSVEYFAEPYPFTTGRNTSPGLSVLELYDVQGADQLSADNPLEVDLQRSLAEEEVVIPMSYDLVTGLYLPLGFAEPDGKVKITALPEASPVQTRSLGRSVKIFFQKLVLSKLGFAYTYPQLAMAKFSDAEVAFDYVTDSEQIKAAVAQADRIVVFLHGIIGNTKFMPLMLKLIPGENGSPFQHPYDLVLTFDYENLNTRIEENARYLKQRLAEVGLAAGHGRQLTLIAHSMGGLVSRWFIEKEGGNQVVTQLIQVGTPNMGSPWSDVYQLSTVFLTKVVNGAAFLQPYLFSLNLLGKFAGKAFVTLQQMDPDDSEFLPKLNDGTDPQIPYTIVAGNTKLIPERALKAQNKLLEVILSRFNKQKSFAALTNLLFKEENDIAVAVTSIYGIPGSENWQHPPRQYPVACDHLSYFGDAEGLKVMAKVLK